MCELPYSGIAWYTYNNYPNTQPQLIETEYDEQELLLYNHKGELLHKKKEPMGFRMGND